MAFRRLFDLFHLQQSDQPSKRALAASLQDEPPFFSTEACLSEIDRVSAGLLELGLGRGDRVALIAAHGSPRWLFMDFGMQQLGIMGMAIHPSTPAPQLERLLTEGKPSCCLVNDRELYDKVASVSHKVLSLKHIFTMVDLPDIPGWSDLLREPNEGQLETFHSTRAAVHEDDPAFIAYTSGQGGRARGVLLSHKNVITNIHALGQHLSLGPDKRYLSLLPPSLIYERLALYTAIAQGATVHFRLPTENPLGAMARIKPHCLTMLPTMVEQVYDYLLDESFKASKLRKVLWSWAADLGKEAAGRPALAYWLKRQTAQALVFPRWQRRLGGQLGGMLVAGDRLRPDLGRLFSAAGLRVWQTYGLTESAGMAAIGTFTSGSDLRLSLLPHLEAKLHATDNAGRGTLLIKGPSVMKHYLDEQSGKIPGDWLVTGDTAAFHDKDLEVFGPVQAQFRLADGHLIFPSRWEETIKLSPFVDQCLVVGSGRPRLGLLIFPRFSLLRQWCAEHDIAWKAPAFIITHPEVVELYERELRSLDPEGRIGPFSLVHQPWTQEQGERGPSLKIRRDIMLKKYAARVEAMFEE